ncbi:acyl-CoA dehydrogenase family protein [Azospirillum sp. A1-3]|uniref:acyl-CoA dehydrogenase family protein n=1 Tax=Azospirillum sp. A1-3 TaxID=185874 RepID=UPI0020772A0D|nr:acyl-CoA dehydrogenase family protein [Azospirillum sp. A1-3]MCM8735361.1 acyl-CoA dehydrogenase family protein [Azospirillum sp. A1-3]
MKTSSKAASEWPVLAVPLPSAAEELRMKARQFARAHILPHADEIERTGEFPTDLWPKLGSAGFLGLTVSTEFGGAGLGYLEHFLVHEEISRASPAVGFSYLVHSHACVNQIFLHGTDAQRRRFLPGLIRGEAHGALAMTEPEAGSDVLSMVSLATRADGGYLLNGRKAWICNAARADVVVVYARTSLERRKISAFVLERGLPGFETSPARETLGMRGAGTADITLTDCRATDDHLLGGWENGTAVLMGGLSYERFVAGGGALGLMQACLDVAVEYARTRRQFGQPIGAFQLVQGKLADMVATVNAARSYAYAVGAALAVGQARRYDSAGLLLFLGDAAHRVASDTVQILGAAGYDGNSRAARLLRDAKFFSIGFGTTEIRQIVVGRELLAGLGEQA